MIGTLVKCHNEWKSNIHKYGGLSIISSNNANPANETETAHFHTYGCLKRFQVHHPNQHNAVIVPIKKNKYVINYCNINIFCHIIKFIICYLLLCLVPCYTNSRIVPFSNRRRDL